MRTAVPLLKPLVFLLVLAVTACGSGPRLRQEVQPLADREKAHMEAGSVVPDSTEVSLNGGKDTTRVMEERQRVWAAVKIRTIPPGAKLYDERGEFFGETGKILDPYVYCTFSLPQHDVTTRQCTITVARSAYVTRTYTFPVHYRYGSERIARRHWQTVVVELEAEGGP